MMERRETVSKNLQNVICTMGTQSKKPNTVVMSIPDDLIMDALSLYRDKTKSVERTEGLLRYELVAVYAEEATDQELKVSADTMADDPLYQDKETPEEKIESMTENLDEVLDKDGEE